MTTPPDRRRVIPRQEAEPLVEPPRQRPPSSTDLAWASTLLGREHNAEWIATTLQAADADVLWLPDAPDIDVEPTFIFQDVLQPGLPLHVHGGEKTLKTSVAAHAAVAVAAGVALFDHFGVDKALSGPALVWATEGGKNYIQQAVKKVCAVYGVSHRSLDVEIFTLPVPINSPEFLYVLAARAEALRPSLVFVEPLYLMHPEGWDGRNLNTWDATGYTKLSTHFGFVAGIGHHDKWGEASSGLRQSSGVGPAQWMGQWWHLERVGGDWDHRSAHRIRMTYGGRGVGGGRVGLLIDDTSLAVEVVEADELVSDTPGGGKSTAYELALWTLPVAMEADDVIKVGDLANTLAGQIQAHHRESVSPGHLQKVTLPALTRNGVLADVDTTGNRHTVTGGAHFPKAP